MSAEQASICLMWEPSLQRHAEVEGDEFPCAGRSGTDQVSDGCARRDALLFQGL
jgi:hypothetical protein